MSISSDDAEIISATPVLASLDIRKSVAFMISKLGFTEIYAEQGAYGIVARGPVQIHFWACNDRSIAEATSCRLQVRGIESLYERCRQERIVHPNAPLGRKPWGLIEFAILDLDGNLITFYEPATD
ncbi:MAG: glyoxalase/bleomycin resistance/extradiol dioxygenase family protein [Sneathiella sp.]|uniref:bleomycin resistance protein n=1 Tax=Sneathiella sp. TaxID=1964365 RepID=UPI000C397771|nr:VOC family protein [Sneathiella sp.]MAZ03873.1 glyoxalase/bleomycin resistance/extradiol dioxygenase family protein [Sneathiella sp.]|tara:strand:- start:215 stop:592 length:378 start_codon:yes stop_codon:yes gene_type:complete